MTSIPIICRVQALYPFRSNDPSSLSFNKDDYIDVLNKLPSGWWDGLCNDSRGWFPSNYVKVISESHSDDEQLAEELENKLGRTYSHPGTQDFDGKENIEHSNVSLYSESEYDFKSTSEHPVSEDSYNSNEQHTQWFNKKSLYTPESTTDDLIFNPPQLLPRSPSRRPSVRRSSLIDNSEPLTWINLSAHVALAIHQLTTAVKANQFQQWSQLASAVVSAVRFMLMTSNTLDKDSSYIKSHGPLKTHHRALMATLSKLVLTSHTHASEQDSEKILAESSELLMAVRRFVSTCQDLALPLYHTDIRWVETQENNKLLESNGNKSARYTLQMNLAENLETMGNCIQDSAETIIKCIAACQAQYSDRASLASLLFTHFRNLANQTGLFIGYLDDTDFSQVQSGDMAELQLGKQALVDGLGQLFYKLQTMTDEKCDLTRVLDQIEDGAAGLFEPIELICANILRLARKGRSRSSSVASYHTVEMSIPALPIAIENSTIHEDDEEEDILSIVDGTEFSSKDNTTFNGTYFTDHLDQDDILSLKIGQEPGSPPRPSDLMERHHSDVTPTASVSDDIAASPPPMIRSYTSPTKAQSSKLKKFFGDDAPIPEAVAAAAKPVENEKPWFLEYDYGTQEIVFNMEGHVKGGTLPALVERLTLHDYLDMNFINTFLLTYRSFCSTTNLMDLLEARYNLPCPNGLTKGDIGVWEEKKLKLVRLRVFNVLKNWLELYYNDDDSALLDRLLDFINTNIKTTLKFSNGQLESLIEERRTNTMDSSSGLKKMILTLPDPPEPILPRNRKRFKLLDIDALELARQLTIMDFKLYSSIRPIECLDKAWSSPDDQIAHNIRSSIEYCNQVTSWVSDVILSQHDIKKRSIYIKFWVQVAERCRTLNNFNTCMAILSAFDNSSVGRLKRTWEVVGTRTTQTLQQIRKLMGANRNFNEYRAIIHSINPPCIPFLGIYLQDLTFIEDGNSNTLKKSKDLINFAKRAKTAEVIREIQQYQSSLYQLKAVDDLQEFIRLNLKSTRDEEQLYKESLKLEPREREDEKITRLLQESGFL